MEEHNDWSNHQLCTWLESTTSDLSVVIEWQNDLRNSGVHFETFDCIEKILSFVQSINKSIIFIISTLIGRKYLPLIDDFDRISAIYLYQINNEDEEDEEWIKYYSKIGGIARNSSELIKYVKGSGDRKRRMIMDTETTLLLDVFNEKSDRSTHELNGTFVWSQLFLDCLLRMSIERDEAKNELISFCRQHYQNSHRDLVMIDEFEKSYCSSDAIRWYTRQGFVYRLLNQSLRRVNMENLFEFRLCIQDLYHELARKHCRDKVQVYRGQVMAASELDRLRKSVNKLVSINSFLSTSFDRQIAQCYLNPVSEHESVLFEITVDPQHTPNKPFADISSCSYFRDECEVLLMPGTIFRTINVELNDDCGIWTIHLDSVSEEENESKVLYEHLKAEKKLDANDPLAFGQLLIDMGQFNQAERYFQRFLKKKSPIDITTSICASHSLGVIAYEKGNYNQSLQWHKKVLALKKKHSSALVKPQFDVNYNSLASIYERKKDYKLALQFFRKSLRICRKELPKEHPKLALCLNNIAGIHQLQQNYQKALKYLQDALKIRQKCLPADHPDLAVSYGNLGVIYRSLGQHIKALKYYDRSLQIYQKSSPDSHPHLAATLTNTGLLYEDIAQYDRALVFYRRAMKILRDSFLTSHPHMRKIGDFIQRVSSKMHGNIIESMNIQIG